MSAESARDGRGYIVRAVNRSEPTPLKRLAHLGAATVHEAYGRRAPMRGMRAVVPDRQICGPAVTALGAAGDNLMIHAAVELCRPGDVLVVATTAPSEHGSFGDLLATQCQIRGLAGVVLDTGSATLARSERWAFRSGPRP